MIVVFDTQKKHTIRAKDKNGKWHNLNGCCLRCGKCGCIKSGCVNFAHETVDDKKLGKCLKQFEKPFMCAVFPCDPDKSLPKGCGFYWG